jgi:hypothetical protein
MMGLVDDQPMRPCRLAVIFGDGRHQPGKKARPFGEINTEKVDDNALVRIHEERDNVRDTKRGLRVPYHHNAF